MNVVIIGTGYVGLVSGACLAKIGHTVTCVDVQRDKIEGLKKGMMPIYEIGLEELVKRQAAAGRLMFTDAYAEAVPGAEVIAIAVGTPSADDGSVDLRYVWAAAEEIARHLNGYAVIVDKSTVPVGTGDQVERIVREKSGIMVDVVSNPEFLREGEAVGDFLKPDRIVIGAETLLAKERMLRLYDKISSPKIVMDRRSAELTKYAANAFLAAKISFINEMAGLAEAVGADVTNVAQGIGSDKRIGRYFLSAGLGWGGSCFPKDVRAIRFLGAERGIPLPIVNAAFEGNRLAGQRILDRMDRALAGGLRGKTVAVLGIAFKGNTDDTRESPAVALMRELVVRGVIVRAHDPVARLPSDVQAMAFGDPYEAAQGAEAVIVATKWDEFGNLDLVRLKAAAAGDLLVDARNVYDPSLVAQAGWRHLSVGRRF